MIKIILYSFLIWLISYPSYSQNVDSTKSIAIDKLLSQWERIHSLEFLIQKYEQVKPDSALFYVELTLELFTKNDSSRTHWLNKKASLLITQQAHDKAEAVLDIIQEQIDNNKAKATTTFLLNKGNLALHRQQLDQALAVYLKGLELVDRTTENRVKLKFYNNIAIIYLRLQQLKKAKEYMELANSTHIEEDLLKLTLLVNLASLYNNDRDFKKAEDTLLKAEALAKSLDDQRVLAIIYTNLSVAYQETKQLKKAEKYSLNALETKQKNQFQGIGIALNNVGYTYYLKKEYREAIKYFKRAVTKTSGSDKLLVFLNLKNAFQAQGSYKASLEYFEKYNELKDSINTLSYNSKIAEINEKYENEEKEKEIAILSAENEIQKSTLLQQKYTIVGVIIFSILLLFIGYLIFRQNKIRSALQHALTQQKFLRIQLNPHFLFNALTGIQHFLFKNETEKSINYLAHFSTLMREVLETSEQDWVPLEREVTLLNSYLKTQEINHPSLFKHQILVDEEIDPQQVMIPTMLIQPFLENSIIHGLIGDETDEIKIKFKLQDDVLQITITDNGTGINDSADQSDKNMHQSMSSDIIKERIIFLRKKFPSIELPKIEKAFNSKERPGTKVTIQVPLLKEGLL